MSDEFMAVATKEVNADIESLENILKSCTNDVDISLNSSMFQKHTHKIKGLAPMMGEESLGIFSSLLDDLFKKMTNGIHIDGVFDLILPSIIHMKKSMNEPDHDFSQITKNINQL